MVTFSYYCTLSIFFYVFLSSKIEIYKFGTGHQSLQSGGLASCHITVQHWSAVLAPKLSDREVHSLSSTEIKILLHKFAKGWQAYIYVVIDCSRHQGLLRDVQNHTRTGLLIECRIKEPFVKFLNFTIWAVQHFAGVNCSINSSVFALPLVRSQMRCYRQNFWPLWEESSRYRSTSAKPITRSTTSWSRYLCQMFLDLYQVSTFCSDIVVSK